VWYENCTDHKIDIFDLSGKKLIKTIIPGGVVTRATFEHKQVSKDQGIPLIVDFITSVEDLPEQKDGVVLVVSHIIREFLPERKDLASPGEIVRSKSGKRIGCRGLIINS